MGSMMKMALPAAAVAAPFIFPSLGAAMGLTGAAGAASGAAAGAGAKGALGGLLDAAAKTFPVPMEAMAPGTPLGMLSNPAMLGAMGQMLSQGQQMPQQPMPQAAAPPMQVPQQPGMGGGLADAMFGGQITGNYQTPMTPDMLEQPRGGLLGPTMISRIG